MKRLLLAMVAALVLAVPAAGQTATDTVTITIEGNLVAVTLDVLSNGPYHVGDTVQVVAHPQDSAGDPVSAILTWGASDTTAVLIEPDALGAKLILLKKTVGQGGGDVQIWVVAQQVNQVVSGWFPDSHPGEIIWQFPVGLTSINESATICTYWLYNGYVVQQTDGSTAGACPFEFLPIPIEQRASLPVQPRLLRKGTIQVTALFHKV